MPFHFKVDTFRQAGEQRGKNLYQDFSKMVLQAFVPTKDKSHLDVNLINLLWIKYPQQK